MIAQSLFGAFWSFAQTAGLMAEQFEFEISQQTQQDVLSARFFYTLTDHQRRNTERNDPCPCGSGLKYKRCHMLIPA